MREGRTPEQHPENHVRPIDETHFDVALRSSDADAATHEDPRLGETARVAHASASADRRLDGDTALGTVAMQPNVESHDAGPDLAYVLDVKRARARPRVHLGADVPYLPSRDVHVFGAADDGGSDAFGAHGKRTLSRLSLARNTRMEGACSGESRPLGPIPVSSLEIRTCEYLERFYSEHGSS